MSANTTEQKELDQQTAKFIATLACNLPALTGEEMQGWISSPKKLKKFLAGLKPQVEVSESEKVVNLDIWKTIKLGTELKTVDNFRRQIANYGCRIGDWANDILGKPAFTISDEELEVDLVIKSVAELGFPNGATRAQIYDKAISLGLELCPAEVGPQLRLQYLDQPKDEWLRIAMEPIADSDGDLTVSALRAHDDDDRWLFAPLTVALTFTGLLTIAGSSFGLASRAWNSFFCSHFEPLDFVLQLRHCRKTMRGVFSYKNLCYINIGSR